MKTIQYEPKYSEFLPEYKDMKEGILYISNEYNTCNHLCPCGCGAEISLPFNRPNAHTLEITEDKTVSITPSIQYRGTCRSHYYITDNKIVPC
jgi:hypothetical protein